MDIRTQHKCRSILKQYKACSIASKKLIIRNQLFLFMMPQMSKWVNGYLAKKGSYLLPEDLLSKSWDAYLYCLEKLGKKTDMEKLPLAFHFNRYTQFFLSEQFTRENKAVEAEKVA